MLMYILITGVIVIGAVILITLSNRRYINTLITRLQEQDSSKETIKLLADTMNATQASFDRRLEQMNTTIQNRFMGLTGEVNSRLQENHRTMEIVNTMFTDVKSSTEQMLLLGKDIEGLKNVLKAPKLRGGLGELMLEQLLAQILSSHQWQAQYSFKNGERVDAIIRLGDKMVPVDSKFPLEQFEKMIHAENDDERRGFVKAFITAMKTHIDKIASKYIRPDEGTYEFALMYIPAENIYYEAFIKAEESSGIGGLSQYAVDRHIVPVSPNSFLAYLLVIAEGLRGMNIEENAKRILANIGGLEKQIEKFSESFQLVGKHLQNAQNTYDKSERHLSHINSKIEGFHSLAEHEQTALE